MATVVLPLWYWAFIAEDASILFTGWVAGVFAILPTALLTLNLAAFPWDYSLFGPRRRTPLPPAGGSAVQLRGAIVVGRHFRQTWPLVGYVFAPEGLGIDIALIGAAFVPAEQILSISRHRWFNQFVICHNCPELRGPLVLFCPGISRFEPQLPGWFSKKLRSDGRERN
jgi:hypothetical protein